MWGRVCQWEKHSQLYIALPAPQCSGLSQWKSAGRGPRPEHHRQQRSELCGSQPSWPFVIFYNLCLPVICQRQGGAGKKQKKNNTSIQFYSESTAPGRLVCASIEKRIQTHAAFQCCCAIQSKRHDAAVQAVSHPRSQNKQNSTQLTNEARCFSQSLTALGGLSKDR